MVHESLIKSLSILSVCIHITISWPANLTNNYREISVSILLQGPNESIMVCVEHVGVVSCTVNNRHRLSLKESIIHWKVWITVDADERVNVDSEGSCIVAKELHDSKHEIMDVSSEIPIGWSPT